LTDLQVVRIEGVRGSSPLSSTIWPSKSVSVVAALLGGVLARLVSVIGCDSQ
jgi:hypothetical protein